MSLPVSHYEALLAEVRGLRRKAQRVQQLATPLLSNCSSDVNFSQQFANKMEPSLTGRHVSITHSYNNANALLKTTTDASDVSRQNSDLSVSEPMNVSMLYHGTWPTVENMWNSEPVPCSSVQNMDVTSVMSFASSSGAGLLTSPSLSRRSSQQLEAKVDMVYSLLAMLSGQEHADMGETLLALSTNPESCLAMRESGCIPLLVQMVQSDKDLEARKKAALALHNLVNSQPDEKLRKREVRIFKLLDCSRDYTEHLKGDGLEATSSQDDDRHPVQTVAHLMKLSFDELHRQAICTLGGIHTIANLVEAEHTLHGTTTNPSCVLLRRYACMALTNLTFGDSGNKALLCSFREFMRALVIQLQSPSDELRQVTASVLRNLSWRADSSSKEILREVGSVSGLMKAAMLDNKENTLKSVLSALWNLSAHCTENKSEICAVDGALGFLVDMLTYKAASKSLAIIENSGGILRNISSQIAVRDDYREILRRHNCLQILLDQLKSPSLTIVSNACGTLWNLSAKCSTDQEELWKMGAPAMLRSLNHSKHKMIAMGSSAALKNLLSARPAQIPNVLDATALAMDLPVLPTLGARKQKALLQDLDQTLAETYENIEKDSPTHDFLQKTKKDFSSLTAPSTSKHYNLQYNSDSGLQSLDLSIDNDQCRKEVSVCSDEKDRCSIEDVSDSEKVCDDSSFSGLAARDIAHASLVSTPTLPNPNLKSNLTMFEGNIDEIDMDDISIHFPLERSVEDNTEKRDIEKEKTAIDEKKCRSGIPLPRSLPRPIPVESPRLKSNIARLSSALPRRNFPTSTPNRINSNSSPQPETPQTPTEPVPNIETIDDMQKAELSPFVYLNPEVGKDRLLERSCEDNPMDNRMLDPDAMIESLDRFTAELVSQASHLQSEEKYKDNTWNEDTSPEVTFPSISGSAPNVVTFDSSQASAPEVKQQSNDFSSLDTSTMTQSTQIAMEANKMAIAIAATDTLSPKLTARKVPKNFMVRRALSNSLAGSSLESLTNLDQINPPSDMETSLTSLKDFVINGSVSRHCFNTSNLDQINPPSIFNEITDLCNSLADVPTEAIGSETEIFEDCRTHIDETEFTDAASITPIQSDQSSLESSPKKNKVAKAMTSKQRRHLARDRYKTYTVAAEMLSMDQSEDYLTCTAASPKKMTAKEKRQNDRSRFETQTVPEAVTELIKQPVIDSPSRSRLSIRKNFMQKRTENRDRFKTQTLQESGLAAEDFSSLVQKEADLVLKNLKAAEEMLECETLSLVSNDEDSENSGASVNYRTYHKSWGLNKNIPVIPPPPAPKPKIVKPSEKAPPTEAAEPKAVRGRRKPLYNGRIAPKTPLKPIRNMTSNLVKNVTSSIKSVAAKPPLERQGTFTKQETTSAPSGAKSRIPTSKIPAKARAATSASTERLNRPAPKASYTRSTSADNARSSTVQKKQVTSKIASLWKKIEESKKQPVKKDTRVWIGGQGDVKVRDKKSGGDDEGKRVSRVGSFIVMDEPEE